MTSRQFCDLCIAERAEALGCLTDQQLVDFAATFEPSYNERTTNGLMCYVALVTRLRLALEARLKDEAIAQPSPDQRPVVMRRVESL